LPLDPEQEFSAFHLHPGLSAMAPDYLESAEVEWAEYEKVACRVLEVERAGAGPAHDATDPRR
jgi:hypothetical protein